MVSKEREEELMDACYMCNNAHVDPELTSDNDFSAFSIGKCAAGYRILFESGWARPTEITFEKVEEIGFVTIGFYRPRYCPNCGRELFENKL